VRLSKRVEKLESQHNPRGRAYPVHYYSVTDGQDTAHTRENCPACAAMSDEQYRAYREWYARSRSRVKCVVIVKRYDRARGF
jgi:hypothetical protein